MDFEDLIPAATEINDSCTTANLTLFVVTRGLVTPNSPNYCGTTGISDLKRELLRDTNILNGILKLFVA